MPDRRLTASLGLLAVAAIAVALRAGPLHLSPLPFNPDGIIHARNARTALAAGQLPLAQLGTDDLLFTAFLSSGADLTGVRPRYIAQPVMAVVGAVPCLLAVTYGARLARDRGWPARQATMAGLLAGGLLAVDGLYLHRSMPTDEQTLGLLFVPLLVVVAVRAFTGAWRWTVVAAIVLVALPATHNLDALLAALALTGLAALAVAGHLRVGTRRALGFGLAGWLLLVGYTYGMAWATPAEVIQSARLTDVPGLVLAWVLVLVLGLAWFVQTTRRTQYAVGVGAFGGMFGLLALNALVPVFPGTQTTPPAMLAGILPLLLLAVIAAWSTPRSLTSRTGIALAALFGGVLSLIGLALTAGLTPDYLNLAYRAQTFLHLPTMVLAGVGGVALLVRHRPRLDGRVRAVALGLMVLAAATSIPVAFGGLSLLSYKGVTTPAELHTSEFAADHVPQTWAADDHIGRLTSNLEDVVERREAGATTAPVAAWTRGGGPPPACPTVIQDSWSTVGAQLFPFPPAIIDADSLARFRTHNNVVYAAGTPDPLRLVTPTAGTDTCTTP